MLVSAWRGSCPATPSACAAPLRSLRQHALRAQNASDRRAFLACLDCHLTWTSFTKRSNSGVPGCARPRTEALRLSCSATKRMELARIWGALRSRRCLGRACEADDILMCQTVKHVAHPSGHELQRAFRQQATVQQNAHTAFGDIARGRGRLRGGHTGQQSGGKFLQHAPNGEVEGVDMHCDALHGRACCPRKLPERDNCSSPPSR